MRRKILALSIIIVGILGYDGQAQGATQEYDGYIFQLTDSAMDDLQSGEIEEVMSHTKDVEELSRMEGIYSAESVEAITDVFDTEQIAYIEPNYFAELQDGITLSADALTNDTYAVYQGYLETVGIQKFWENGLEGQDADFKTDMDKNGDATDDSVVIAVIDSGLNYDVDDIDYSRILTGVNMLDGSSDVTDEVYHGTFVTGMLAAKKNNQLGIAGLLENVYVLPMKCFEGQETSYSYIIRAIDYAVEQKLLCESTNGKQGANICVINLSLGATASSKSLKTACESAMEAGIIVVCAAGNSGNTNEIYPAQYTMGVGAVDSGGNASDFSQILVDDDSEGYQKKVWICAPGEGLYSYGITKTNGSYLRTGKGTSFACPIVSALAALCKSVDNTYTQDEFMELTKETAVYIDSGSGVLGEQDIKCGYGMVNFENVYNYFFDKKADCTQGHSYEVLETVNATCDEEGYIQEKCSVCGTERTEVIEATGHKYEQVEEKEATCSEAGYRLKRCNICQDEQKEVLEVLGHVAAIEIVNATCENTGYESTYCKVCGAQLSMQELRQKGHNYIIEKVIAPTYQENGYTILKCQNCAKFIPAAITARLMLDTPMIDTITNVKNGIKLTWSKVPDAHGYHIYRKKGDTWILAGTVPVGTATSYTDKKVSNGKTYTYKISAYTADAESMYSTSQNMCYLKRGKITEVTQNGNKKILVCYQRNKKATGYQIQYATGSKFKNVKTITIKAGKKTYKVIRRLRAGRKCYVRIRVCKKVRKSGTTHTYYGSWSRYLVS